MNEFIPRSKPLQRIARKSSSLLLQSLKNIIHKKHRLWKRWISTKDKAVLKEYKNSSEPC